MGCADARLSVVGAHPASAIEQEHDALIAVVAKRPADRPAVLERRLPVDVADRISRAVFEQLIEVGARTPASHRLNPEFRQPSVARHPRKGGLTFEIGKHAASLRVPDAQVPVQKSQDGAQQDLSGLEGLHAACGRCQLKLIRFASSRPDGEAQRHRRRDQRRVGQFEVAPAACGPAGIDEADLEAHRLADSEGMRQAAVKREGCRAPLSDADIQVETRQQTEYEGEPGCASSDRGRRRPGERCRDQQSADDGQDRNQCARGQRGPAEFQIGPRHNRGAAVASRITANTSSGLRPSSCASADNAIL